MGLSLKQHAWALGGQLESVQMLTSCCCLGKVQWPLASLPSPQLGGMCLPKRQMNPGHVVICAGAIFTIDIALLFNTGFVVTYNLKKKLIMDGPKVGHNMSCTETKIFTQTLLRGAACLAS